MLPIFSLFLLSTLLQYSFGQSVCPDGFRMVNGKCLLMFPNALKHLEAAHDCSYFGGTLVTVRNALENRAIATFANSMMPVTSIWLGMACFNTENSTTTCYFDDNSGVVDYNQFAPGNPSVSGGTNCVYMQASGKDVGKWYSAPCDVTGMPFICEVPMTMPDASCAHNYNGYCYMGSHETHLATVNTTYNQAQSICQSKGADLVSFHSKREIDFVRGIYADAAYPHIFIGAKAILPGTFTWSDGSYWNFDNTDPLANSTGSCMVMDLTKRDNSGMWSPADCHTNNYFMCKRKIGGGDVGTTPEAPRVEEINPKFASAASDFSTYANVNIYDASGNYIDGLSSTRDPFQVLAPGNLVKITYDSTGYPFRHGFSAKVLPF